MNLKYFGTDGIRGPYGGDIINENLAYSLGNALVLYLKKKGLVSGSILLGRDPRLSGEKLLNSAVEGIRQAGFHCMSAGILPTPALAYGVIKKKCQMGIMITASHNPPCDNGLKLFSELGGKLSIEEEIEIESLMEIQSFTQLEKKDILQVDVVESYFKHLEDFFSPNFLSGLKIVADLANGATSFTTPKALRQFGADLICINQGEGEINCNAGSESTQVLQSRVIQEDADLGIAHDGDGDRVIFVDSFGKVVDGDCILGLLAKSSKEEGFVATVHSNSGLGEFLNKHGMQFHRSAVGDRNVSVVMNETGCSWGGESSGHIVSKNFLPTGDGLFTALSVLSIIQLGSQSLHQLADQIKLWPSQCESFTVETKIPLEECDEIQVLLIHANNILNGTGRILLRYSGTENKLRLFVEAKSLNILEEVFTLIATGIKEKLCPRDHH